MNGFVSFYELGKNFFGLASLITDMAKISADWVWNLCLGDCSTQIEGAVSENSNSTFLGKEKEKRK